MNKLVMDGTYNGRSVIVEGWCSSGALLQFEVRYSMTLHSELIPGLWTKHEEYRTTFAGVYDLVFAAQSHDYKVLLSLLDTIGIVPEKKWTNRFFIQTLEANFFEYME